MISWRAARLLRSQPLRACRGALGPRDEVVAMLIRERVAPALLRSAIFTSMFFAHF